MKKGDVIQLAVIVLALILGFVSIQYFFSGIASLIYYFSAGEFVAGTLTPSLSVMLIALMQGVVCWLMLSRSRHLADFIYEKSNIGTSFKIISRPGDLLFVLLIVTGFYYLLDELPSFIKAIVLAFKSKAPVNSRYNNTYDAPAPADWLSMIIHLLLPLVLLMFAKPIADYFAKGVSDEPAMIGDDMEQDESTEITEA